MNYRVEVSARFEKEIKKLIKKYPSIKGEYEYLIADLKTNPVQGISLGKNCFKIRISIASKNKGKSGGARVITYIYFEGLTVYLLSIFDKSDQESITDMELNEILKELKQSTA